MNNQNDYLSKAHKASFKNIDSLRNDKFCGCFYCLRTFSSKEIEDFVEEKDGLKTALCPYCGVDSIIGKSSGFPITKSFLSEMHARYFETNSEYEEN